MTWEQRMAAKAAARRAAEQALRQAQQEAAHKVAMARALANMEPCPCERCYFVWAREYPPSAVWWHVWPEDRPYQGAHLCRCDCHGGGWFVSAIAFAAT